MVFSCRGLGFIYLFIGWKFCFSSKTNAKSTFLTVRGLVRPSVSVSSRYVALNVSAIDILFGRGV